MTKRERAIEAAARTRFVNGCAHQDFVARHWDEAAPSRPRWILAELRDIEAAITEYERVMAEPDDLFSLPVSVRGGGGMSEADILSQLRPCPFCGAGETDVRIRAMPPRMEGPGEIIAVVISHHCPSEPGFAGQHIETRGLDAESAISQWNARAGGG